MKLACLKDNGKILVVEVENTNTKDEYISHVYIGLNSLNDIQEEETIQNLYWVHQDGLFDLMYDCLGAELFKEVLNIYHHCTGSYYEFVKQEDGSYKGGQSDDFEYYVSC